MLDEHEQYECERQQDRQNLADRIAVAHGLKEFRIPEVGKGRGCQPDQDKSRQKKHAASNKVAVEPYCPARMQNRWINCQRGHVATPFMDFATKAGERGAPRRKPWRARDFRLAPMRDARARSP